MGGYKVPETEASNVSTADIKACLGASPISFFLILLTGPDFTPGGSELCKRNKLLLAYAKSS